MVPPHFGPSCGVEQRSLVVTREGACRCQRVEAAGRGPGCRIPHQLAPVPNRLPQSTAVPIHFTASCRTQGKGRVPATTGTDDGTGVQLFALVEAVGNGIGDGPLDLAPGEPLADLLHDLVSHMEWPKFFPWEKKGERCDSLALPTRKGMGRARQSMGISRQGTRCSQTAYPSDQCHAVGSGSRRRVACPCLGGP